MNLKGVVIITLAAAAVLVLFKVYGDKMMPDMKSSSADSVRAKSGAGVQPDGSKAIDEAEAPASRSAKYVEIEPVRAEDFNYHEVPIDVLGYREIRVFAHLSANDSKHKPLPKESRLTIRFGHELKGMGTSYVTTTFRREFSAYIEGWVTQPVYGKKLKLIVDADNLPKGKYTLHLTYYLLP